MAFADSSTYFNTGDSSIIGMFTEREVGNYFEYSHNNDGMFADYPHKIWVTNPIEGIDQGYRYGRVLKTVAYLVVDEDEYGNDVVEKWSIKDNRIYEKRS